MASELHVGTLHHETTIKANENLPAHITLNEITLREEVVLPVALSMDEKFEVAKLLVGLGVEQLEVQTRDAAEIRQRTKDAGFDVAIQAICRPFFPDPYPKWQDELDAAISAGVDKIEIVTRTSDNQILDLGQTKASVSELESAAVEYAAKANGPRVLAGFADCTRADRSFLEELAKRCVSAGAWGVQLPDTLGVTRPATMRYFVSLVKSWVQVPIGVHCHNDLGLGLANALAAAEAGADIIDVTLNGMDPERVGLVALEEVATVLYLLYDRDCHIDLSQLYDATRKMAELTGIPLASMYKPIVGDNAFAQKRELTLQAARRDSSLFESFDPSLVGNKRWVSLASGAGPGAVSAKLQELKLQSRVAEGQIPQLVGSVNELASAKRRSLTDEEFIELVQSI